MTDRQILEQQPGMGFLGEVNRELRRAERYRIFMSVLVFDLEQIESSAGTQADKAMARILELVQTNVREIDILSVMSNKQLGLLFPETSRQGAEIVARRLADLIQDEMQDSYGTTVEQMIPLEMASYPDAAGAKSLRNLLDELGRKTRN